MIGTQSFALAIRYCGVSFLLLLLSGAAVTAQDETKYQEVALMQLKPDKETIMVGEPMFLALEITNLTAKDLCLGWGADYRNKVGRPDSFTVSVKSKDGADVPQPDAGPGMGGFSGCQYIKAADTITIRLFLPHWATIERPGSYRINVKRKMNFSTYDLPGSRSWQYSMLADLNAEFEVIRYDANEMGGVINSLGSVMLDASDPRAANSAQALASIKDPRVISYFAEAVHKLGCKDLSDLRFDGEFFIIRRSIFVLGDYDDDRAIEALEAAMDSPNEVTRGDVVTALRYSPHKSALKLLLRMHDDKDWSIRRDVALALEKLNTKESITVLNKLAKDENEDVRSAAKGSLARINADH